MLGIVEMVSMHNVDYLKTLCLNDSSEGAVNITIFYAEYYSPDDTRYESLLYWIYRFAQL